VAPPVTWEDYARAERFLPWNAAKLLHNVELTPHWIAGGDTFWYRTTRKDGIQFVTVDPETGTREPAFDHVRLAAALSAASGIAYDSHNLPFTEIELADGGQQLRFDLGEARWTCNLATYACSRATRCEAPADVSRSPDGRWDLFVREHNLWLRAVETGEERALTTDGEPGYGYGAPLASPLAAAGLAEPDKPVAIWSPDSRRFLSCRIDERHAQYLHLVQSVPTDGTTRPRLHSYAYPLPGDVAVPMVDVWCFETSGEPGVKVSLPQLPMLYYGSPLNPSWLWWREDGGRVFLLTRDRGYLGYRLHDIDTKTGDARTVVEERAERGIDPYLLWAAVNIRVTADGTRVIWYGARDGWGHLYLYDAQTGALLRQLTAGPYNVAEIAHVDEDDRWVYFTAVGREQGRDPYYPHLYRVSLDGSEPELLTPEDAAHAVWFAPSGRYFVDTFSRLDSPPVSLVRSAAGMVMCELERADIEDLLATGWRPPERFAAKARDGVTDVYGVIFRPSRFDPNRRYPIIDNIYGGPQVNQTPTSFADSAPFGGPTRAGRGRGFWHAQALAELGFVVVMIDGLGMPGRAKAYSDAGYRNLADGGIPDHIAVLRQLADRYPYLDLSRVGIFGHSAGGYASTRAILSHPDFYKVCVASAGNHDHRLDKAVWVERYMGLPVGDHYREQANQSLAHQLQGKLLLIHPEMDENVHPASTMVVVDALIKANKDFDLLILPNLPHFCDGDPYFVRKRWDYFVRHLLGVEPPPGYRIEPAMPESAPASA
jgi:dipeptidyl-peptidase 4